MQECKRLAPSTPTQVKDSPHVYAVESCYVQLKTALGSGMRNQVCLLESYRS